MDFAFRDLIGKFIEIYQDDLTVFSKKRTDNVSHLRKIFERCRKYGISLNPKKSVFGVNQGKLLGHIVSKDGIKIDSERIEAINIIRPPTKTGSLESGKACAQVLEGYNWIWTQLCLRSEDGAARIYRF